MLLLERLPCRLVADLAVANALQFPARMKTLMLELGALICIASCAVETDELESTSQSITDGYWECDQRCASGGLEFAWGSTPDEAYRGLLGCGPGGGAITCDFHEGPMPILEISE